jgi:uncharacterized membrane protein YfhO
VATKEFLRGVAQLGLDKDMPRVIVRVSPFPKKWASWSFRPKNSFRLLFKMTWHTNWRASVDGRPAAISMLSPGFIGVPISTGRHTVEMRHEGSAWKLWLALAGLIAVAAPTLVFRWSTRAKS